MSKYKIGDKFIVINKYKSLCPDIEVEFDGETIHSYLFKYKISDQNSITDVQDIPKTEYFKYIISKDLYEEYINTLNQVDVLIKGIILHDSDRLIMQQIINKKRKDPIIVINYNKMRITH